jgi:hypothetical protein
MKNQESVVRENAKLARSIWGPQSKRLRNQLEQLTRQYSLSVTFGDIQQLGGRWYVTFSGLLRLANRRGCNGISVCRVHSLCDPIARRWVFRAIVYRSRNSRGFVGHGDADPSNVSPLVLGAELRVAETRAVNRALRKAYGIGLCSVEELGWEPRPYVSPSPEKPPSASHNNGHRNGHASLRDRLCLLIRQHQLDANLVKAYAADSCGTPNLRDATREQIEGFIANLSDWATKDRPALLCKLNSYSRPQEVTS